MKKKLCSWFLVLAMVLGLLPASVCAVEDGTVPLTAKNGEEILTVAKSQNDYTYTVVTEYDDNWNPVTTEERTVDLYVVTAPSDVETVTLDFGEELRIAYSYDANGNYLAACGEYGDGTNGQTTAAVTDLTAYIRVQTPYDANWQSDFLYAVAFEVEEVEETVPFTAKNGEDVLTVTKSKTDYTYTVVTEYDENWNPVTTEERTVDLYVVSADTEITEVTLDFGEELRIAYAYDANGNYLSACGEYGDGTTGQPTASATDLTAYVRVQTPYDENWQSDFLYAVAFDIPEDDPDEPIEGTVSVDALLSNIAASYAENSGEWVVMDMAAYEDTNPDSAYKSTADAKQAYIDSAIAAITAEGAGEAAYAKAIVILQSIGADPQTLYPTDSDTPVSAVDGLKTLEAHSSSAWVAPYTLMALNQGDYDTDELEQSIITSVLTNQAEDGSWSEWGDSIQTTANMIAGLSFYYDSDETVKTAVDKAVTFLSSAQKEDGTFDAYGSGSDANTAAMVVIALSALGIDPDTDERFIKHETSALDGLLSFALADNTAFGYTDNSTANSYATEQGFRALIAADTLRNVYDFSTNEVSPAYVGGAPSDDGDDNTPGGNTPVPDTDITVSITVKTHRSTWISNMRVEMAEDSTVADLIYEAAVQDENFSFTDSNGYISAMTYDGETWAEFDAGRNSGWKYTVNGLAPVVGMNDRVLEDGDKVTWYYVTDYTTDNTDDEEPVKPQKPIEEEVELPFADTEDHWAQEAITYCYSKGLMAGTDETTFAPDLTTSRGMIVTILYALEEKPSVSSDMVFVDVDESAWYADAAAWAYKIGIVSGYGDGCFGPDDEITREQMALILMNYARYKGYSTKKANDLDKFSDAGEINAWALDALRWANAEGMMSGRGEDTIAPLGTATRAEAATILMKFLENNAK